MQKLAKVFGVLILFIVSLVSADDWPQWRGPNRDGISKEVELLKTWPPAGPKVVWRAALGSGYSSMSISQGRVFTMASFGTNEFAIAFDEATDLLRNGAMPETEAIEHEAVHE